MFPIALLPDLPDCSIEQVSSTQETIIISLSSTREGAACPDCGEFSFRRHLFSWLRQSLDQLCKLVAHPMGLGERREERQRLRVKSLPLLNDMSASGFSR